MQIDFIKMHGLGNDFVVIDNRELKRKFSNKEVKSIADRHLGIGCDQLVLIENSPLPPLPRLRGRVRVGADCFMRIYNADGSEVASCGNASRCVASLMFYELDKTTAIIETKGGILSAKKAGHDKVTVNMGKAGLEWRQIPLSKKADTLNLQIKAGGLENPVAVSIGNPHMVFFVENIDKINLEELGPKLQKHPLFPESANIGVAEIKSAARIRLRVFERGAGETLACGTGACAALVAANRRGLTGRKAVVELPGGDLSIEWKKTGEVLMTGPVAISFCGFFELN